MSLRLKLVTIILFVALVPLAVSSFSSWRLHQRAFNEQLRERQRNVAVAGADLVRSQVDSTLDQLQVASHAVHWPGLRAAERQGALWLIYGRSRDVAVVALLDDHGKGMGTSAYVQKADGSAAAKGHPPASTALLTALSRRIPFRQALDKGSAVGEPFRVAGENAPTLPIAIKISGTGGVPWVVLVGLSMRGVCAKLTGLTGKALEVHLADTAGRSLCAADANTDPRRASLAAGPSGTAATETYDRADGKTMLAAVADAGRDWRVIAEQPRETALAPGRTIRNQALYWLALGVIVALGTGVLLARGISKPIDKLVGGAQQLADGHYDQRIAVDSGDELGRLSRTFNHMSEEIERRDAEIREWNVELQQRVEARTRELADAQQQLLQSQKVAAVSTLGAGIAHEINNPLSTVLGTTQLVRSKLERDGDTKMAPLLADAEAEAKRIRDIVDAMLRFSQDQDDAELIPIAVNDFLDRTLELTAQKLEDANISVERDYAADLPAIRGNDTRLSQAILHVVSNAVAAMSGQERRLLVTTRQPQAKIVEISIRDSGRGMPEKVLEKIFEPFFTTKDEWTKQGLGLTEAHNIISEHHGTIRAESTEGVGTTLIIHLPAATEGAHLA